jgi:uncharacterized protein YicC (UPF0701 family)
VGRAQDIGEELTRPRTPRQLRADLTGGAGPPFDFIQEVNTAPPRPTQRPVAIAAKGTLEKMREQVQNLE